MKVYLVETGFRTLLEVTDSLTAALWTIRQFLDTDGSIDHAKVLSHTSPPLHFKYIREWSVTLLVSHDKAETNTETRIFHIKETTVKTRQDLA